MQTTNRGRRPRRDRDVLVDIALALDLFPADAVRFIPVKLRLTDCPTLQPDQSDSFEFTLATPAVAPAEPLEVPDTAASGDRLDLADLPDDLECHRAP